MKKYKQVLAVFISAVILALLIFDTKTAVSGAADGIELCIKVIIPSLFPFFFITIYMNSLLTGLEIPGIRALGKLLHIPRGSEPILLLGLIGGYPVGAKMIGDAFTQNKIDRRTGRILLGYCSNAGPAFIFGVAGTLFTSIYAPIVLWIIHILSAIITGLLLPKPDTNAMCTSSQKVIAAPEILHKSISACISVCGWVIVFKIIMAYLTDLLSPFRSNLCMILIAGVLELSNGCLTLAALDSEPISFLLCSAFIAMGGICVALQTISVTGSLKWGLYIPGKIMQACISLFISILFIQFFYHNERFSTGSSITMMLISLLIIAGAKQFSENYCGNPSKNHV